MKLEAFMEALGRKVEGAGTIYLTGGATALLFGWRAKTIDVDIKADPEPRGFFVSEVSSFAGFAIWTSVILIFTVKRLPSWSVATSVTCLMYGHLWKKGWWIGKNCVIFLRIFALH